MALKPDNRVCDAVGVRTHSLGVSMVAMGFLFRFASRCNAPLTSNDFNKQSQISSLLAGLRKG